MKKVFLSFILISLVLSGGWGIERATASTAAIVQGTEMSLQTDSSAVPATTDKPFDWKGLIIGLLFLAFYAYAIVWIVITLVNTKRLVPVTKQEFISRRKLANKAETATDEENRQASDYIEQAFNSWKIISGPGEEELRSPVKMVQIKRSKELHAMAEGVMPTDDALIDRFNEMAGVINAQEKRSFSGSWKLVGIAVLSMVIMYFMTKSGDSGMWYFLKRFWFMPVAIVLYYFASLAPAFLQNKRARWFRGLNIHNVLIGTVLGLFMATPATEAFVTTWSDGSKTKSDEINPFFIFMLILTFILVLFLGFMTIIFAGINFIRNYVIYV